jgi:hypothetical protein
MLKIYSVINVEIQIKSSMCWIKHHEKKACGGVEAHPIFVHANVFLHAPAVLPLEKSDDVQ